MKVSYIKLLDRDYPLCFSLTASQELAEAFGGLDKMSKELASSDMAKMCKAVNVTLNALMKAGRIYAGAIGRECPEPLPCEPCDVIDMTDPESIKAIFAAINGDTERSVETKKKKPTQAKK